MELSYICVMYRVCYSLNRDDILVRVGTGVREKGGRLRDVKQIISYPYYDNISFDSDIALLKVCLLNYFVMFVTLYVHDKVCTVTYTG
jgi:hypothetical protein